MNSLRIHSAYMYKNLNLHALGHALPFDQACALARQHGFAGVDLDLSFLKRMAASQSAQEWFAQTGLRAGAFGLSARWHGDTSNVVFEQSLSQLADEARLAAGLGCSRCVTWIPPGSDSLDFRQHWSLAVDRLGRVAALLAEHGLRLGLEFVGPLTFRARFRYGFIHTLDGARALAAAVSQRGGIVGLLVDSFHWYTAHGTLHDLATLSADEVVYVHVNDAPAGRTPDEQIDGEREMVGSTGVIDIHGFLGALRRIGYDGPVTVEPFNQSVRAMSVEDAVRFTSESLDCVLGALG